MQDINDIFRDDINWGALQKLVLAEVAFWADKRGLESVQKPIAKHWQATIGSIQKNGTPMRITSQCTWEDILTQLRQLDYTSKGKLGKKGIIDCFFKTYDWELSPPPKEDARKIKLLPKRTQRVQFQQDGEDENISDEAVTNDQDNDEVLSGAQSKLYQLKASTIGRSSTTKNQLDAKHAREH
jgi:hypothetical protein